MSRFNKEQYEKIQSHCAEFGADLLVVTKGQDVETIKEAYDYGHRDFGENRLQEALPKITALPSDIVWHFIGSLQTNKVQKVLDHFSCIHSIDRFSLIDALVKRKSLIPIFLQVNVTGETSKGGFSEGDLPTAVQAASSLNVLGVMTMAEHGAAELQLRQTFRRARELARALNLPQCSMGMSDEYRIALEEGASVIRIGRMLFDK